MRPSLYFEDLEIGQVIESQSATLTESQIMEFAWAWDPQPFHVSRPGAEASMFGGVIASGFHTLVVTFRLLWQGGPIQQTNVGGTGIDNLRWSRPVRAGDTLRATAEVAELRPSSSKPFGTVRLKYTTLNQDDEVVMTCEMLHLVAKRSG
ncbi:MaoC family dehydratase [Thalassobaculum sp.]|uniref:MaoC family dehydratase n=1 Tax=Thalassobaculum sp. TaxID=2022740 RepID=UPI0032EDCA8B